MASATASTKVKVSGYAKRNNASAAVPLEIDSDSDFNPGAYIPEDTKKKNKRTKRASHLKSGSSGGKKRQRDSDDDYDVPKTRKRYRPDVKGENPLLEFFSNTTGLCNVFCDLHPLVFQMILRSSVSILHLRMRPTTARRRRKMTVTMTMTKKNRTTTNLSF
ncbi:hypothetical protein ARMGADRAFT_167254 [Armillaria gallica]|uniref:Uncharacterized protein n=1 Tax=Armillaria gallica TaxID=47427 RepID=A0A2H3DWE2_ARMGA|nr:hypothetical protein ARMGADRAFT_167254 [Armillaria gallica]